jgi:hypothetical protein
MATITGVVGTDITTGCTGPNAGKSPIAAGDVNGPFQSVCNGLATVKSGNCTIAGNKTFSGSSTFTGTITATSAQSTFSNLHINSGGNITADSTTSFVRAQCRKRLLRPRLFPSDVGWPKSFGVSDGDRIELAVPVSARVATLKSTTDVPEEGETIEFVVYGIGSGTRFTFKREDATTIARFVGPFLGSATSTLDVHMIAEFEYSGGLWRLGRNSGLAWDPDGLYYFGVLPGVGA